MIEVAVLVGGDPEQHVLQIREGCDIDEFTTLNEGVEEGGTTSTLETPREQPVPAADRDDAQLVFRTVIVDGEPAVLDKALERGPLIREIPNGIAQRRFRQDRLGERVALGVDAPQQRHGLLLSKRQPRVGLELGARE